MPRRLQRYQQTRDLVEKPEDWQWSSFRHHLTGIEGVVEIESATDDGGSAWVWHFE